MSCWQSWLQCCPSGRDVNYVICQADVERKREKERERPSASYFICQIREVTKSNLCLYCCFVYKALNDVDCRWAGMTMMHALPNHYTIDQLGQPCCIWLRHVNGPWTDVYCGCECNAEAACLLLLAHWLSLGQSAAAQPVVCQATAVAGLFRVPYPTPGLPCSA